MSHDQVLEITDANFDQTVMQSDTPVIVDFWAEWCGPCKMLTPIIDDLAGEYDGKVRFGKVNVDNNPAVASRFGITSIPTLIFVKGGSVADQHVGLLAKEPLKKKIDTLL